MLWTIFAVAALVGLHHFMKYLLPVLAWSRRGESCGCSLTSTSHYCQTARKDPPANRTNGQAIT
jgi:hypothetical protein